MKCFFFLSNYYYAICVLATSTIIVIRAQKATNIIVWSASSSSSSTSLDRTSDINHEKRDKVVEKVEVEAKKRNKKAIIWTRYGETICNSHSTRDACHGEQQQLPSNTNSSIECVWCEFWCLFRSTEIVTATKSEACSELSHKLETKLREETKVHSVIPVIVLVDVPTLITITGDKLHRSSPSIHSNVRSVTFAQNRYNCQIISHSENRIQCILLISGKVHETVQMIMEIERKIYNYNLPYKLEAKNGLLRVVTNYDEKPLTSDQLREKQFPIVETMIAVSVSVISCSIGWMIYIKRRRAYEMTEWIERIIYLKKMKKKLIKKRLYVKYCEIKRTKKLGDGNFGEVYQALVQVRPDDAPQAVAIKILKKGSDLCKMKAFMKEGLRMGELTHERILHLLGIIIDQRTQMPVIVSPIMANGDLCRYLRQIKVFPIAKLLSFAMQIAEGMEYLSSMKVVHCDLAARNCLLDERYQIKICDFGLSRQIQYRADYVHIADTYRPIRWMAIECLRETKTEVVPFTEKSDVWSYGVVLWEIFTVGSYPYEEIDIADLASRLRDGYRLRKPSNCPVQIFGLMTQCWSANASNRHTFREISEHLRFVCDDLANETDVIRVASSAVQATNRVGDYVIHAERFVHTRNSVTSNDDIYNENDEDVISNTNSIKSLRMTDTIISMGKHC